MIRKKVNTREKFIKTAGRYSFRFTIDLEDNMIHPFDLRIVSLTLAASLSSFSGHTLARSSSMQAHKTPSNSTVMPIRAAEQTPWVVSTEQLTDLSFSLINKVCHEVPLCYEPGAQQWLLSELNSYPSLSGEGLVDTRSDSADQDRDPVASFNSSVEMAVDRINRRHGYRLSDQAAASSLAEAIVQDYLFSPDELPPEVPDGYLIGDEGPRSGIDIAIDIDIDDVTLEDLPEGQYLVTIHHTINDGIASHWRACVDCDLTNISSNEPWFFYSDTGHFTLSFSAPNQGIVDLCMQVRSDEALQGNIGTWENSGYDCIELDLGPDLSAIYGQIEEALEEIPPADTTDTDYRCFGALGVACGLEEDSPLGVCSPSLNGQVLCAVNGGSWEHDECCAEHPDGVCGLDDGIPPFIDYTAECADSWVKAWSQSAIDVVTGYPLKTWFRTVDPTIVAEPDSEGRIRVDFSSYCAPAESTVDHTDIDKCCTHKASMVGDLWIRYTDGRAEDLVSVPDDIEEDVKEAIPLINRPTTAYCW